MTTEQELGDERRAVGVCNSNGEKGRKIKTCKCGIFHSGYYSEACAVCVVCERAGIGRHETIALKIHDQWEM